MSFCTFQYFVFFSVVFCAYWLLKWDRARLWLLLAASFVFYASWNVWLAALICASTTIDYLLARAIDARESPRARRWLVGVSVVMNVGLLSYFKYANFFLASLEQGLRAAGATSSLPVLRVILPIGISFYTFEAISYVVDVARRRVRAERRLDHLLLFILFFPHLVAGPIVRGRHFLPQIRRSKPWNWARVNLGAQLVAIGVFKKIAIADRMALFSDPVFAHPASYRSSVLWIAALAYSLQIYCDFSGYTDIALGSAHMLGYKLPQNFSFPYLSSNISTFWRRWNITLSTWLRDYVYIPMGGSRGSTRATLRNLMITMALGGLWHGAKWTFVIWGVLHGTMLSLYHLWRPLRDRWPASVGWVARVAASAGVAMTFVAVSAAFVVFRADTLSIAGTMWSGMIVYRPGSSGPIDKRIVWLATMAVAAGSAAGQLVRLRRATLRMSPELVGAGCGIIVALALLLGVDDSAAFIYFQF